MGFFDQLSSFITGRMNVSTRFALLREAISGTMSKFYMARDLRSDEVVGLKILDREKTAAFEARFKGASKPSEGEIGMMLNHPRIARTYECGLTTDGSPYVVMEFLEGAGMNSLLVARDAHLDGRRVRFIREAAEAVAAVHAAGFIHRDVCPRNFLLTGDGEHVKLTDFGLTVPATPPFMQPGIRTGTPAYMAPELVRRQATDQRVDIFAFGVTAYEICTFELPWPRGDGTGLAAMSHNQPPTDIRRYCPKIDIALARAIHSCIEPDLDKRCRSIERFLTKIRVVRSEEMR